MQRGKRKKMHWNSKKNRKFKFKTLHLLSLIGIDLSRKR